MVMLTNLFYKFRFSYDRPRKIFILNNKINELLANIVLPVYYKIAKIRRGELASDVIVSLTTFPPRMKQAVLCINSLLRQTVRPQKIILWLADSDYSSMESIPNSLKKLTTAGLEIRFCEDLKSYKKIFYTAKEFSAYRIVTADDDFFYPETWLEELIKTHEQFPENIICHRCHRITQHDDVLDPYGEWDWYANGIRGPRHSLHTLTGAGVIFPSNFFFGDFFEKECIKELAPTTDDMWIKVYALRRNIKIMKVKPVSKSLIQVYGSQRVSLISLNQSAGNDKALNSLLNYYGIDLVTIIKKEKF